MKKLRLILPGLFLLVFNCIAQSQNRCSTAELLAERIAKDPSIGLRMQKDELETQRRMTSRQSSNRVQSVIIIPVVVHVVYHTASQNISNAQIQSQLDVLNADFRLLNSDALPSNHAFYSDVADAQIQFCLATKMPNGNATTGITRTYTAQTAFFGNGAEKYTLSGGVNNWNPTKYLNIWVCNFGTNLLGYATFPSDLAFNASEDGVVISYKAFGNMGTATAPYNLGRTAVHEIGHWLNLRHIWGDDDCGDDFVDDTKPAFTANGGCPSFPYNAFNGCGSDADGEMYMNYMDYVVDDCMNMFTNDQAIRMQDAINGTRSGLLSSSSVCNTTANVTEDVSSSHLGIFPNPNNGNFSIRFKNEVPQNITITIVNMLGETVATRQTISSSEMQINLPELTNGAYYVQVNLNGQLSTSKVFIAK